jgi:serine protease Do
MGDIMKKRVLKLIQKSILKSIIRLKCLFLISFLINLLVPTTSISSLSASRQNAITKAVSTCSPAVVGINVIENRVSIVNGSSGNLWYDYFFGQRKYYKQYQVSGGGSGFLISSDGYILTNHHVAGNASKIVVTLTNGEKYDAEIVGADLTSDICLLKIEGKNFPYLKFANSNDILVGEWTIAMGNPFGLFDYNAKPVVTVGIVSNVGISFLRKDNYDYRIYRDMVQTDASISSGNSGGPLLNANGEVIGMNTIIFTTTHDANGDAGSIGIGFAVPVNRIKRVVDLLKKNGKIDRNINIGITVSEIDEKVSKYYKLDKNEGIFVYQIDSRSAATNAGLDVGDIIEKINGRKIMKSDDLLLAIGDAVVGDKLTFEILRGKQRLELILTIPPVQRNRKY